MYTLVFFYNSLQAILKLSILAKYLILKDKSVFVNMLATISTVKQYMSQI